MKTILAVASIWALSSFVSVTTAEDRACSFTGAKNSCYCKKESSHTMCIDLDQTACCSNYQSAAPTESDIKVILERHNEIRNKVAAGEENACPNPECDKSPCQSNPLPAASNMNELCWDAELAATAQKLADTCRNNHEANNTFRDDLCGRYFAVGQNIAGGGTNDTTVTKVDFLANINNWYSEVCRLPVPVISKFSSNPDEDKAWGHYTQLIWAKTTSVGCGAVTYICDGWIFNLVICNYGQSGNLLGAPVYEISASKPPTLTCSTDAKYPFLCKCEDCKKYKVDASCGCSSTA